MSEQGAGLNAVLAIFRIGVTIYCVIQAQKLNRSALGWGIFGFFLPLVALIWIQFMKPKAGGTQSARGVGEDQNILDAEMADHIYNSNTMNSSISSTKNLLFFDVETTGMPRNWKAPVHQTDNWPRVVQLAWILTDQDGQVLKQRDKIIRPNGFSIPIEAERIHGISTERARVEGYPIEEVLDEFRTDLDIASSLIAHNIDFDNKVLGAEFFRLHRRNLLEGYPEFCTMKEATNYCRLPGKYGYKWPTLEELHAKVFNKALSDAHNAMVDVQACKDCFFALRNQGVFAI